MKMMSHFSVTIKIRLISGASALFPEQIIKKKILVRFVCITKD